MKMSNFKKFFKHLHTVNKHRRIVRRLCFRSGIFWRGLVHDLSKYSFAEFWTSVKYFTGTSSPINGEREEKGYSNVWMHHKGRNKHHPEYWIDKNSYTGRYEPKEIPMKYVVESVMDRIAAVKVYYKKNFDKKIVLNYFLDECSNKKIWLHEKTYNLYLDLIELYVSLKPKDFFKIVKRNIRANLGYIEANKVEWADIVKFNGEYHYVKCPIKFEDWVPLDITRKYLGNIFYEVNNKLNKYIDESEQVIYDCNPFFEYVRKKFKLSEDVEIETWSFNDLDLPEEVYKKYDIAKLCGYINGVNY